VKIFDKHFDKLTSLPSDYSVSLDHMKTEKHYIKDMSNEELHAAIDRVKNASKVSSTNFRKDLSDFNLLSVGDNVLANR
jgi:uncharacterized protein YktB (UPF0637 family)